MIFSYRKTLVRIRFFFMFILLTYLLYHVWIILMEWVQPVDKYKPPEGKSVKAFHHQYASGIDSGTMADRLRFFYWYGE